MGYHDIYKKLSGRILKPLARAIKAIDWEDAPRQALFDKRQRSVRMVSPEMPG